MTLENLDFCARISVPQPTRLVTARRDYLVALRVELDLTDLTLVAFKESSASARKNVVDAGHSIS